MGEDGEIRWANVTEGGRLWPVAAPGVDSEANCTCDSCSWRELYDIDNCGSKWAPLYFVSFFMLGAFIMLNLIIAVVLENFSNSRKENDDDVSLGFRV